MKVHGISIFLCTIYAVPETSKSQRVKKNNRDLFEELERDIVFFKQRGVVIGCGDPNARLPHKPQVIHVNEDGEKEYKHKYHEAPRGEEKEDEKNEKKMKYAPNTHGRELFDLCNATGMLLANGLQIGNRKTATEEPTTENGTVIDVIFYDEKYEKLMSEMKVIDSMTNSDHRVLIIEIDLASIMKDKESNTNTNETGSAAAPHEENQSHAQKDEEGQRTKWKFNKESNETWTKKCETDMKKWEEEWKGKDEANVKDVWNSFKVTVTALAKSIFEWKEVKEQRRNDKERKVRTRLNEPSAELIRLIDEREK